MKSRGTIMSEKIRRKTNKLTRVQRDKLQKSAAKIIYTHQDKGGMAWRMVGSRPVSRLADEVMQACGMKGWT